MATQELTPIDIGGSLWAISLAGDDRSFIITFLFLSAPEWMLRLKQQWTNILFYGALIKVLAFLDVTPVRVNHMKGILALIWRLNTLRKHV